MRTKLSRSVVLVALAGVIILVLVLIERQRQNREEQLTSYYGVKLGSSKNEVGYNLGYPSSVQGPYRPDPMKRGWQVSDAFKLTKTGDVEGTPLELPGGSALKKYDEWNYDFPPDQVTVTFDADKKTATSVRCLKLKDDRGSRCRAILGVTIGSSEADVVKALGSPERQEITGVFKSMQYQALGIELMLAKRRVYLITKTLPRRA